jgi:DNA-binding beta-propeller fold protein YncE
MGSRRKHQLLIGVMALVLCMICLTQPGISQTDWAVTQTLHIGGDGGWDYITADSSTHRLYVTRSTHTQVIDAENGKVLGDIPGQKRSHGVALVPAVGRGFISDGGGDGQIVVFDLKTNAALGTIPALADADGIIYDASVNRVLAVSGDKNALITLAPDVNPSGGKIDPPIDLDGAPEFLAADGKGKAYINLEDKNQVAVVDLKQRKVIARWPVSPGGSPVGMAMDGKKRLLFIGCRNPQKLIVMNADTGKIIADLPIGAGVDATKFDGTEAFASCRDGKLEVAKETAAGKFEIVERVATPVGARTMTVDPQAHKLYLPTAEMEPAAPGARPAAKAGTFMIVVVSERKQ